MGGDHEQPGAVPVQDPFGLPVEQPGAPLLAGLDPPGPAAARPGPVEVVADEAEGEGERAAGQDQGGGEVAGGDPGQQGGPLVRGAEGGDQGRGEAGGGEQRCGQQGAPGLLAHEGRLGGPAAGPAVLLREREARQPELLGEPAPQVRVVALGGAHRGGDRFGPSAPGEEVSQRAADRVLLCGEGGVHRRAPFPSGTDGPTN